MSYQNVYDGALWTGEAREAHLRWQAEAAKELHVLACTVGATEHVDRSIMQMMKQAEDGVMVNYLHAALSPARGFCVRDSIRLSLDAEVLDPSHGSDSTCDFFRLTVRVDTACLRLEKPEVLTAFELALGALRSCLYRIRSSFEYNLVSLGSPYDKTLVRNALEIRERRQIRSNWKLTIAQGELFDAAVADSGIMHGGSDWFEFRPWFDMKLDAQERRKLKGMEAALEVEHVRGKPSKVRFTEEATTYLWQMREDGRKK